MGACGFDERRIVDGVLRDFPFICLGMKQRREYLLSTCAPAGDAPRVQGGEASPLAERFLERLVSDVEYCELSAVVEAISDALQDLSASMRSVVEGTYFRGQSTQELCAELHVGEKWIRIRRSLSYDVLSGPVFRVYPVVRRWRSRERMRREEAMRILCG